MLGGNFEVVELHFFITIEINAFFVDDSLKEMHICGPFIDFASAHVHVSIRMVHCFVMWNFFHNDFQIVISFLFAN
uniref:Uncharacterized protein n=1 Tax=Rhizophora mucronata TaxID=61149 RepID=A0A2P2NQJ9_RHIMU